MLEVATQLVQWERIKSEIAECKDITVMGKMNYSLDAIQRWAKQSNQSLETQNEIAEYRLHLNRKQGEWIEANIPENGGNPQLTSFSRLEDIGINRNDSPKFRVLARIPKENIEAYISESKEGAREITTNDACHLLDKTHVSYASGNNEWYTPPCYLKAAWEVMNGIDTDPASTSKANEIVKAETYFTSEEDGRLQQWRGNVWLNPPYAQPLITDFCKLLIRKYQENEIQQACVLVNNATETTFYQDMLNACSAVCFIKGRVKFIDEEGRQSGSPLQGQSVLYFGNNIDRFSDSFSQFGVILYVKR